MAVAVGYNLDLMCTTCAYMIAFHGGQQGFVEESILLFSISMFFQVMKSLVEQSSAGRIFIGSRVRFRTTLSVQYEIVQ